METLLQCPLCVCECSFSLLLLAYCPGWQCPSTHPSTPPSIHPSLIHPSLPPYIIHPSINFSLHSSPTNSIGPNPPIPRSLPPSLHLSFLFLSALILLSGSRRKWNVSQVSRGEDGVTPCSSRQLIAGPRRETTTHTHPLTHSLRRDSNPHPSCCEGTELNPAALRLLLRSPAGSLDQRIQKQDVWLFDGEEKRQGSSVFFFFLFVSLLNARN